MDIGILGSGNLAVTLGQAWVGAGHKVLLAGRDLGRAQHAARHIGPTAGAVSAEELAAHSEVVVIAIAWSGLESALALAGAHEGRLSGKTVIDTTNPVDYATGRLLPSSGSAAELVARVATGSHVVKALHLFAGASWPYSGDAARAPIVALCGDRAEALTRAGTLITALGGRPLAIGGLDAARQAEEVAGFVTRIVANGANPRLAIPEVHPATAPTTSTDSQ